MIIINYELNYDFLFITIHIRNIYFLKNIYYKIIYIIYYNEYIYYYKIINNKL